MHLFFFFFFYQKYKFLLNSSCLAETEEKHKKSSIFFLVSCCPDWKKEGWLTHQEKTVRFKTHFYPERTLKFTCQNNSLIFSVMITAVKNHARKFV